MPRPDEAALSPSSHRWLAGSDPDERKRHGQYLTPRPVADALVGRVDLTPGMRVLDPGVGTGEILAAVARACPRAELTGWDIDPAVLSAAGELLPGARLEQRSALDPPGEGPDNRKTAGRGADRRGADPRDGRGFDLVIGNPPYFQVPVTAELKHRFGEVISGRANVFALFFKAGLDLLRPGGTVAFVVPPSMNSGAYFEALREYIVASAQITDLTVLEGSRIFEGANTAAQLLVLRKATGPPGTGSREPRSGAARPFVFEHRDAEAGFRRVIFSRNPEVLAAGFDRRRSLWQLGFEAVTGSVVWNEHRDALREVPDAETVPLVWSGDLRGGVLDVLAVSACRGSAGSRPGYISGWSALNGPALLVNRVVGSVGRGELRTALVPEGTGFVAENHVNVIRPRRGVAQLLDWPELQDRIADPGAGDRLRMLTGNTQISATELTHLLPV